MRARMAIESAGIEVEVVEVSLKNKPQSLLDYSAKGTVPVLITREEKVIDQSRDIMLWALHQADPGNWLMRGNQSAQAHITALVDRCDFEFKPLLDRYKYFDRHPEYSQREHRERAEFFLIELENNLQNHLFLLSDAMSFADIAIFPFIRQFAGADSEWFTASPYPKLQAWLEICINTREFKAIMDKTWQMKNLS